MPSHYSSSTTTSASPAVDGAGDVPRLDPVLFSNCELRIVPRVEVRDFDMRVVSQDAHHGIRRSSATIRVMRTPSIAAAVTYKFGSQNLGKPTKNLIGRHPAWLCVLAVHSRANHLDYRAH
jgi:hypothetical protein